MLNPAGDIATVLVVPGNVTVKIGGMPRIGNGHDRIKSIKKAKITVQHIGQPIEYADPSKIRVP